MLLEAQFGIIYGVDIVLKADCGNTTSEMKVACESVEAARAALSSRYGVLSNDKFFRDNQTITVK